ncbi:MAG: DUF4136 domain-containing protein [Halioglobus sp.]
MSYRTLRTSAAIVVAAVLAAVLGACASSLPTAVTDFDGNYNFSEVRKIAIQPFSRANPATVVVSDMQVQRIDEALAVELRNRGFEVVTDNAQADLLLAWHLVTQERTDVRSFNTTTRYSCWNCGSNISVRQYTQGTFIVDLIDPVALRSVWRSTMQSRMRSEPDPQQAEENRRAAAQVIFAEFPPLSGIETVQ